METSFIELSQAELMDINGGGLGKLVGRLLADGVWVFAKILEATTTPMSLEDAMDTNCD